MSEKTTAKAEDSPVDLSKYTDTDILAIVSQQRPKMVEALCLMIAQGRTDAEILMLSAVAGGSAQAARYTAKCIRAIRSLSEHSHSPDPARSV